MALAHSLGFPRIGADRELKKALESYWKGDIDQPALERVGRDLRARHWAVQRDAGIELLPVGDFAWYDQVLSHSLAFGVIPKRSPRRWERLDYRHWTLFSPWRVGRVRHVVASSRARNMLRS